MALDEEQVTDIFFIMLLVFLGLFFVVEALMASYNAKFGHTTGIIVMLGILISFIIKSVATTDGELEPWVKDLRFKEGVFFDLILPLIIFPSGFNMRRKKFFANIGTIMKFGFVGTMICFTYYTAMCYGASKAGLFRKTDKNGESVDIGIQMFEILSICSLLCSSDVIAAISMINYKDQPKLFSIVYGEGVFNDIVSIILFNTVTSLQNQEFTASTPFTIIFNFLLLAFSSLAIGLLFGIVSSLMFKYARFLCHSAITETILLLIIGMICYFISESLAFSGIISLLVCGITMAHYTWYNLSPQGKTISSVTFSIFGSIAESLVFAYIGLCVFTYSIGPDEESDSNYYWSASFIGWMTVIVIGGRVAAVFTAHGLFSLCAKKKDVSLRELLFISYGGMIRGAIAFGLVLKIPIENEKGVKFQERGAVVTTTLALVIITTVVFGSFMPVVQAILVPPAPEEEEGIEMSENKEGRQTDISVPYATKSQLSHMSQVVPIPEEANEVKTESHEYKSKPPKNLGTKDQKQERQRSENSHYDQLVHPNDEQSEDPRTQALLKKKKDQQKRRQQRKEEGTPYDSTDDEDFGELLPEQKGCAYYFDELDKKILKPILVYKYNQAKMERQDQVNDFLLSYANVLGSVIGSNLDENAEDQEFFYEEPSASIGNPSQFQSQSNRPSQTYSQRGLNNQDMVSSSQAIYRHQRMIEARRKTGQTGKFAADQSRSSFGQGELRSNTTWKHSNQSMPAQFQQNQRRTTTKRVNSIYNRYGLAGDNPYKEALRAQRKMQQEPAQKIGTRQSGVSIAQTEKSFNFVGSQHGRNQKDQAKAFSNSKPNKLSRMGKQASLRADGGRQMQIGSLVDISEQASDADMYMSGLSRPTNNDKQTADFMRSGPSLEEGENRRSEINISNEEEAKK